MLCPHFFLYKNKRIYTINKAKTIGLTIFTFFTTIVCGLIICRKAAIIGRPGEVVYSEVQHHCSESIWQMDKPRSDAIVLADELCKLVLKNKER